MNDVDLVQESDNNNTAMLQNKTLSKVYIGMLQEIPSFAQGMSPHRMLLLYFATVGCDLLRVLDKIPPELRQAIRQHVVNSQCPLEGGLASNPQLHCLNENDVDTAVSSLSTPTPAVATSMESPYCGSSAHQEYLQVEQATLTMTHCGLHVLATLGELGAAIDGWRGKNCSSNERSDRRYYDCYSSSSMAFTAGGDDQKEKETSHSDGMDQNNKMGEEGGGCHHTLTPPQTNTTNNNNEEDSNSPKLNTEGNFSSSSGVSSSPNQRLCLDTEAILNFVSRCQNADDGGFAAHPGSYEGDVRATYSALMICYLLGVDCSVSSSSSWSEKQKGHHHCHEKKIASSPSSTSFFSENYLSLHCDTKQLLLRGLSTVTHPSLLYPQQTNRGSNGCEKTENRGEENENNNDGANKNHSRFQSRRHISKVMNVNKCIQYILACQTHDGSFSGQPDTPCEGHGGMTYCAVSSLQLLNVMHLIKDEHGLRRFCAFRQCSFTTVEEDAYYETATAKGRPRSSHTKSSSVVIKDDDKQEELKKASIKSNVEQKLDDLFLHQQFLLQDQEKGEIEKSPNQEESEEEGGKTHDAMQTEHGSVVTSTLGMLGFQGRINKPCDVCYAFWIGATMAQLDSACLASIQHEACSQFSLRCQDRNNGGFAKYEGIPADPLHTCLALKGIALRGSVEVDDDDDDTLMRSSTDASIMRQGEENRKIQRVRKLHPTLGCSMETAMKW